MTTRQKHQRHHCGECHRFVREDTVETYWSIEEGCEVGSGECSTCGRTEVYLDRWPTKEDA